MKATICLACLLLAGSLESQEHPRIALPLTVLGVAASVDVVSTFTSASNAEDNPVVAWMNPAGLPATIAVEAAIEVVAVYALCRLLCDRHPRLAKALLYTGSGIHGSMAAKNWHNRGLHQQQAQAFRR